MKKASSKLKSDLEKLDPNFARMIFPWIIRNPRYIRAAIRLMRSVKKAKKKRVEAQENGLLVPPFLIISITSKCNLFCTGCYAAATGTINDRNSEINSKIINPLKTEQWRKIIGEARELGVIGFVVAGGEPFLYPGLLDLCEEFKDRLFLILTNGTAFTKADYKRLKRLTNLAIIVSVEGGPELTNSRRGEGVYEKAMDTLAQLNKMGMLTGISATITRINYRYWMDSKLIDDLISKGVRFGVFIEYIPLTPGIGPDSGIPSLPVGKIKDKSKTEMDSIKWDTKNDHALMLTPEERAEFRAQMLTYRETKPIYIVHSPGDEEYFGGCISAGRGFAHITPTGDLTPCPVSNIATHNLTTTTLREGLESPLFKEVRKNEHLLETEGMPCALFAHPKEVDDLVKSVGAYRTNSKVEI
ncbi:MAG: radical SAM protein [Thermoplasmata archaeon]|nr:MAG: radical SAM protein [Thermoplasmata archaeon]